MEYINSIELQGRVGTIRTNVVGETKVANFSLATEYLYKTRDGAAISETTWHNIVAWGKIADQAEKLIKKGKRIALEGRLRTRIYEKDGKKNYFTEITMNEFIMIDRTSNDDQAD